MSEAARSKAVVALEAIGLAASAGALAVLLTRVLSSADPRALGLAAAGALAGYVLADLASGLVHWFCDRFFEEDTPGIGPLLIFPFRDHHRDPAAMTRHGWLELCGSSAVAVAPVLAAGLACGPGPFAAAALLVFGSAILATNLFHCWAHAPRVPRLVGALQRAGWILSPAVHARHHQAAGGRAYCVTSGWVNRVIDAGSLLPRLERTLASVGVPVTREP